MNKNRKKLLKILVIILVILALTTLIYFLSSLILGSFRQSEQTSYSFYYPDWEYDISTDKEYLEKDLNLYYIIGNEKFTLNYAMNSLDKSNADYFFVSYFEAVICGDNAGLNDLLSDRFISVYGKYKPFTMQRIYDINIYELGDIDVDDDNYDKAYKYAVEYKIMKNDGTFRKDIGSDESRKTYFYIVKDAGLSKLYECGEILER